METDMNRKTKIIKTSMNRKDQRRKITQIKKWEFLKFQNERWKKDVLYGLMMFFKNEPH